LRYPVGKKLLMLEEAPLSSFYKRRAGPSLYQLSSLAWLSTSGTTFTFPTSTSLHLSHTAAFFQERRCAFFLTRFRVDF